MGQLRYEAASTWSSVAAQTAARLAVDAAHQFDLALLPVADSLGHDPA